MEPVCQTETSPPGCVLNWNTMQSDEENQCRTNTVWNLECQQLGHLFLFSSNTQQPFMLEQGRTDSGLGIWSGRSLTNDEKIFSGLNGEMFYALCSPRANLKTKEKILTTKALEKNCSITFQIQGSPIWNISKKRNIFVWSSLSPDYYKHHHF